MKKFWRKVCKLGQGSYGTVSLAQSMINGSSATTFAAVKSAEVEHSSSIRTEGVILNALKGSPYIVQCFGEDESVEDGKVTYNLLLEYAAGGTLLDLIRRGMSESEVAHYAFQLLQGISYVHREGIIHCDLKPSNILVFPGTYEECNVNVLKLADFGLALEDTASLNENYYRGTLIYGSPEAVKCGFYSKSVDIWALGCIVAEMITGSTLWSGTASSYELELTIRYQVPEIPTSNVSRAKDFMAKCLERDHNRRWTADMLLNHPFIKSARQILHEDGEIITPNPFGHFGSTSWVSSKNLFSTCSLPSSSNPKLRIITAQRVPGLC